MKKKYIIVTGGAGFVGSNLIELLISKTSYNIISLDNYSSGSTKNHVLNSKKVKYLKGNTKNFSKIFSKIKKQIVTIFHFGEYARIHQSFDDYKKCFDSNISGSLQVFDFCLQNNIKLVYSATSASLGNNGKDENISPYAFSKSKNLQLLENLKKWFGFSYEAVYFYNVYGPKQIKKGPMATVVGIFEYQFENNKSISVVKPGSQSRNFTYIKDTVEGCYKAWKISKEKHYLITNSKSYTVLELARMFSSKITFLEQRRGERYKSSVVSSINGRKLIKIHCPTSIKDYVKSIKSKKSLL